MISAIRNGASQLSKKTLVKGTQTHPLLKRYFTQRSQQSSGDKNLFGMGVLVGATGASAIFYAVYGYEGKHTSGQENLPPLGSTS